MSNVDAFLAGFDAAPVAPTPTAEQAEAAPELGEEVTDGELDLDEGDALDEGGDTGVDEGDDAKPAEGDKPGKRKEGEAPAGEDDSANEPDGLPAENTKIRLPPLQEGGEERLATVEDVIAFEKQMFGFVEKLRADPIETLLAHQLVDREQLEEALERRVIEKLKLRVMSDEERKTYTERQELEAWRKQKAADAERQQSERQKGIVAARQTEIRARVDKVITAANLAGTPGVKTVAVQVLLAAAEAGRLLSDDDLARATRAKVERTVKALSEAGDGKALAALLGPKVARKIALQHSKARPPKGISVKAAQATHKRPPPAELKRFRNTEDFLASL